VLAAFFVSGFAGLMHQVVWAKLLVQLIGATAHAQAAVLAVFMGGLAIGAAWFGRRVDRHGRPLRTYVLIECAIAGYCLLLPLLLAAVSSAYLALAARVFESSGLTLLLRTVLAAAVVLPPAVLMGATLPLLARSLIGRVEDTQRRVADLYALNSLGAVLGAGLAGFITLPLIGVHASLAVAAALNGVAALLVWPRARREGGAAPAAAPAPTTATIYRPGQYRGALAALALSGFAAMGYEVIFTRLIALACGASTYSFTIMLMAFISGIALGGAIASRLRAPRPLWLLALTQLAVVVTLLATTPALSRLAYAIGRLRVATLADGDFPLFLAGQAALSLAVLLVPTTCLGLGFPLVARVQARQPDDLGWRIGSTYAWNTVGNVLGATLTGALFIPWLGVLGAFHVALACSAAAGLVLLAVAEEAAPRARLAALAATAAAAALYLAVGGGWTDPLRFARAHLRLRQGPPPGLDAAALAKHPAASFAAWQQAFVIRPETQPAFFFAEDAHATVLAFEQKGTRWLVVNGKPDASTAGDLDTQLLLAHAPLFLSPQARTVLVIGYGSGITAGAALRHPVERVDVVEISPAVMAADGFFAEANQHVLADPRVRVFTDDGQSFVRAAPQPYDVIISEPSNPWIAGIGGLFTVEFFTAARDALTPGGVFVCWLHTYEQTDENVALILRTLQAVFPEVTVFANRNLGDAIAVASVEPLVPDFAAMEARFATADVRANLGRLGVPNLAALLSHHRVSPARLRRLLGDGPLNTAGHERLEYLGPRAVYAHNVSYLLEEADLLLAGAPPPTDVLLDQYLADRGQRGTPLADDQLEAAARYVEQLGGYGEQIGASIRARAAP
jgi:spermidine synthase/MFS family permease